MWGGSLSRGSVLGDLCLGGLSRGGLCVCGGVSVRETPPREQNACEYITLPQTHLSGCFWIFIPKKLRICGDLRMVLCHSTNDLYFCCCYSATFSICMPSV